MRVNRFVVSVAALGGLVVVAAAIRAQDNVTVAMHGFQDTRGVTVLSPLITLDKDFTDRTGLRVRFGVDAISAASDSCARCHDEGASSGRVFLNASAVRTYGDTKVSLGGEMSRENFYSADTLMGSVSRALNKANTTVTAGYSLSFNRPVLHPLEEAEHQHAQDMYASLTQTLTRSTIVQLAYDYNRVSGYQSTPFLRTRLNGQMAVGVAPELRNRQALTARIRQALPAQMFLEADYRRYHDSWSVDSNALSIGLSRHIGERVVAAGSYRLYDQTAAFFYAPRYTGSPQYFTGDFRLFPFDSDLFTGRLDITPKQGFWNMPPGTALTLQYDRYLATTGFQAGIVTGGVRIPLR